MDYRLLRLILIDSYSPGRVVELPMEGGAVLTGRNGRGKNSRKRSSKSSKTETNVKKEDAPSSSLL